MISDHSGSSSSGDEVRGAALPCLNSYISIESPSNPTPETLENTLVKAFSLSVQNRRTAFNLAESVKLLCGRFGIENIGFLTLTFREHIICPKEAQKRLNSLLTNVVKKRYEAYCGVFERQKSGRIHYHLLVAVGTDIRTGVAFEAIAKKDYKTAGQTLRAEWAFWRKTAPAYGFGRTELMPVKTSSEAIGKYVGKYIAKHIEQRDWQDKGIRLIRMSSNVRAGTTRFQFLSEGSRQWRAKVKLFAQLMEIGSGDEYRNLDDFSKNLGKSWAYRHGDMIASLELDRADEMIKKQTQKTAERKFLEDA